MVRKVGLWTMVLLASAAAMGCGLQGPPVRGPGLPPGVTLTRDAWGVPTITGRDDAALAFGMAYAMAEDGLPALEEVYASATGRSGEWHGEAALVRDRIAVALKAEAGARAAFATVPDGTRAIAAGFADGLNFYLSQHPSEPRRIARYEPWMVIAAAHHVRVVVPLLDALAGHPGDEKLVWAMIPPAAASSPVLLVSGYAGQPYEVQLRSADGWSFRGVGALGLAWPSEGFGNGIAYAHSAPAASALLERVRVDSGRMGSRTDTVRVNTTGGLTAVTVHTPVFAGRPVLSLDGDTAVVVRDSALLRQGVLAQLHALSRATDRASFLAARAQRPMAATSLFVDGVSGVRSDDGGATREIMGSAGHPGDRAAAAGVLLADRKWTMDDAVAAAFDRHVYGAQADIALLIDEWEQAGAYNPDRAAMLDRATAELRDWDRNSRGGSPEMTLYAGYRRALEADSAGALPRFRALETALSREGGVPARPWERVNRILSPVLPGTPQLAIPVAGAPGRFGIMFAYDGSRSGQHYVWVAETATGTGRSVLSHGQSSRAASRHSFDQAALFSTARLKPVVGVR